MSENLEQESPATLGDVLYPDAAKSLEPEQAWARLVQGVADGDQLALHALYERAHRAVFTLIMRITGDHATAEELTLDVFHDVWRRAQAYDPENGTVLGWIMNQARSRAIDRLRFEQRLKRTPPANASQAPDEELATGSEVLEQKRQTECVRRALAVLSTDERHAIETAYFQQLTHAEAAARLQQPLGTVKTRIRSGLHKLRQALDAEKRKP